MAIQDVKVINSENWATETTLKRLLIATETQFDIKTDGVDKFNNAAKKGSKSTNALATGLDSVTRSTRNYQEAIWDLEKNANKFNQRISGTMDVLKGQNTLASMMTNTASRMQNLGITLSALGGGSGRLSGLARVAGTAVTGLAAVATASAAIGGRFIEAGDTFRSMIETGVIFDGSVTGMIQSVRRTGMSLENAAQLIQNHSETILITGEQRFFNSVTALSRTFSNMGMDATQGAEALANLTEIQRLNGSLFVMSEQDRIQANTTLLHQMDAQRRLTGVSLKRQQDEQAALNRRERVRLLKAGMSAERAPVVAAQEAGMLNMGMSQEVIEAAMLEAFEGISSQKGGFARSLYGSEYDRIIQQLRSGETIGSVEQRAAVEARIRGEVGPRGGQRGTLLAGQGAYAEFARGEAVSAMERTQAATRALPGQEDELRRRQEDAAKAMQGQSMLQTSTVNLYDTQTKIAATLGTLEGTLMRSVQPAVEAFLDGTSKAATATLNLARSLENNGLTAILAGLHATLGTEGLLALAGGAAATAATRAAANRTQPEGGGGRGLPPAIVGFGAGATRLAGRVLGIGQLISAYTAYSQGNYGEMAAHLGLAAASKNPIGMFMSLADWATEMGTGRGIVTRAASMFSGRTSAAENTAQESLSAAAAAQLNAPVRAPMPAVPTTGALTPEQAVALEAQTQSLAVRIGEIQSRGADARNQELVEAIRQLTENSTRLSNYTRQVANNTSGL